MARQSRRCLSTRGARSVTQIFCDSRHASRPPVRKLLMLNHHLPHRPLLFAAWCSPATCSVPYHHLRDHCYLIFSRGILSRSDSKSFVWTLTGSPDCCGGMAVIGPSSPANRSPALAEALVRQIDQSLGFDTFGANFLVTQQPPSMHLHYCRFAYEQYSRRYEQQKGNSRGKIIDTS